MKTQMTPIGAPWNPRRLFPILFLLLVGGLPGFAATLTVTSAGDGVGSTLRNIVEASSPGDTIVFAPGLSGQTILLTNQITLSWNITIDGSTLPDGIQINGNSASRIFELTNNAIVVLNSLTLTNGYASLGGAIFNNFGSALTLDNSTIAGCSARYGGAIYNDGPLTLNQCTLSGNTAYLIYGGAIEAGGAVALNQSTITGNTVDGAGGEGGGIYIVASSLTLTNSIVAGNTASVGADILNFQSILIRAGTNIIQSSVNTSGGTDSGPAAINAAPRLAPLGNYGGPTQTMPPLFGSPAVDAGSDSLIGGYTTDQRGYPRASGAHVDIGAVEAQYAPANNPPVLMGSTFSALGGAGGTNGFQFAFSNVTNADFTVLASTNLALPLNEWVPIGNAMQNPPGQYLFTDPGATNYPQRFYQVVSP